MDALYFFTELIALLVAKHSNDSYTCFYFCKAVKVRVRVRVCVRVKKGVYKKYWTRH